MTNPANPPSPQSAGAETPAPSPVDEGLQNFWKKNGNAILVLCALVLLGYVGKAGWEYFAREREAGIQQEFAAADAPEKLQAFADAHPSHALAGLAELRIADFAYASGRLDSAIIGYGRAIDILKTGPLAARARLGLAMAKIQSGLTGEGEASLHQLADDPTQYKAIRAEATYQLASLAASSGQGAEVEKYSVQLMQIDPNSPWTQRAFGLQSLVSPTGPAANPANPGPVPAISFRPGAAGK
jgi:predicted negative regulator of RcsB-dependent stress response